MNKIQNMSQEQTFTRLIFEINLYCQWQVLFGKRQLKTPLNEKKREKLTKNNSRPNKLIL
jgi:hypothetical protein